MSMTRWVIVLIYAFAGELTAGHMIGAKNGLLYMNKICKKWLLVEGLNVDLFSCF